MKRTRLSTDKSNHDTTNSKRDTSKKCQRCERPGHLEESCWATTKTDGTKLSSISPKQVAAATNSEQAAQVNAESSNLKVKVTRHARMIIASSSNNAIMLPIVVAGKQVSAMVDTGSDCTIMHRKLARQLNL